MIYKGILYMIAVPTKLNVSHLDSKVNKPGYSMVYIIYIYIYIYYRV